MKQYTYLITLLLVCCSVFGAVSTDKLQYALDCDGDTTDSAGNFNGGNDIVDYIASPYDGQACDFTSGNSDYIDMGDQTNFTLSSGGADVPATLSFWMRFDDYTVAGDKYIWSKYDGGIEYYLYLQPGASGFAMRLFDGTAGNRIESNFPSSQFSLVDGNWYHLMFTYDGSGVNTGMTWYVNGVQANASTAGAGSYTTVDDTVSPHEIGGLLGTYVDGALDMIYYWKGVEYNLTEAQELYNANASLAYPFTSSPELDTYFVSSAYANISVTGTEYVYTRDDTPSIPVNITVSSNISCGKYNLNYSVMIANNSETQAATTDTTEHTCTIPISESLIKGPQTIYVSILDSGSVNADLWINISQDWNVSGIVKDRNTNALLQDVRVITREVAGGEYNWPEDSNSTDITDSNGQFTCWVPFTGNYTTYYEYTNTTNYNSSALGPFNLIQ